MKKSALFFSFLLVPIDYLMIVLAGISAYYLRFSEWTTSIRPVIFTLDFNEYLRIVMTVAAIWIAAFILAGLYKIRSARKYIQEIYSIIQACSVGFVLIVILIFIRGELFNSRFIVLAGWILAIIYIIIARGLIRALQRFLYKFGIGINKVVIVGNSKTADNLIQEFSTKKNLGFEIVKRVRNFSLETAQELEEFIKHTKVDEIIQSDPNLSKSEILRLFDFADEHHITFKFAADLLGTRVLQTEVSEYAGIPIVEVKRTTLEGWGRIIKRIFDIILALVGIIVFAPLMVITAIAIKLDSRGPIIYKNERVGKGGELFKLYKFRSMLLQYCTGKEYNGETALEFEQHLIKTQNSKDGPVYKIADDPRLTRVGKFIRRWSIDELPQFFNVLIGNLSLVGPRPHQPREVAKYERHHKKVLTIKPGMTGLAQISGRSDLSFEEEVKLDTYYIENWTLWLDFAILLRTPLAVFRKRKVV
ncbi:sugar transferase [Candidatus Parcubacteria bacterium]|nr:MAG: sugar transferase [Candidatus Parcubacteria bacterium]